jgi:predicted DNA-binding transcriptional regulator AlpA
MEVKDNKVPSRFEQLWTIEEVATYLAMSPQTLYGCRCRKHGPPSYRLGTKVRYPPEKGRAWVDAQSMLASATRGTLTVADRLVGTDPDVSDR